MTITEHLEFNSWRVERALVLENSLSKKERLLIITIRCWQAMGIVSWTG